MNKSLNFISMYNESLKVYEDYKKDFLGISILYMKFLTDNKNLDNELKKVKLNKLINTYSIQKNHKFKIETYNRCKIVWTKLNQFLETNIWLAVNALENSENIKSKDDAKHYCDNIDNVIIKLGLKNINVYGNSVINILNSLRTQIGVSR